MLKAMYDNGIDILTKEDAALYDLLAGSLDFVISEIGNQLEVTSSGLTITLKTGQCLIKGRHVVETIGNTTLLLPANSSGYIVISYDITKANGYEAELMYVSSIVSEDLNNNGQRRDFPLYSFVSTAAVITLTDLRVFSSLVSLKAKIDALNTLTNNLSLNKANKSTIQSKTLAASSWTGASAPFLYSLSVPGVTMTSIQELSPTIAITQAQLDALQKANIQDAGQSIDTINLKAWGIKPTIDIPVNVLLRGDI